MKKRSLYASLIFLIIFFQQNAYSGPIKNFSAFYDKDLNHNRDLTIDDPSSKIIIVYNHGGNSIWSVRKCYKHSSPKNMASMSGDKINGKTILVYFFCLGDLFGDDAAIKRPDGWTWSMWKPPYKGKTKTQKKVEANLELVEKFVVQGVPRNQIFITGWSVGARVALVLASKYIDKVGGVISFNHAFKTKFSKDVKKKGYEKAYNDLKKKFPNVIWMAETDINQIKQSKHLPILVFTHPLDKFDGQVSDWIEKIPGVKRIIISDDYTINGRKCRKGGHRVYKYHRIVEAECFQEYNSTIKEYIASRITVLETKDYVDKKQILPRIKKYKKEKAGKTSEKINMVKSADMSLEDKAKELGVVLFKPTGKGIGKSRGGEWFTFNKNNPNAMQKLNFEKLLNRILAPIQTDTGGIRGKRGIKPTNEKIQIRINELTKV